VLPTIFEFHWDAGHMIFFGAFYAVLTVALTSLLYVAVKSLIDVYREAPTADRNISESEPLSASEESAPETQAETSESQQEALAET
jgi:hypothetical protein